MTPPGDIASGRINIDINDEKVIASLRRIDAEFERAMSRIERERAVATAELKTSDLDQDVKNVKRKLRELQGKKVTLKVGGRAFKRVSEEIAEASRELKKLDGKRATMELKVKGQDEIIKARRKLADLAEKEQKAAEQARDRALREWAKADRSRAAAIRQRARISKALRDQEAREERDRLREQAAAVQRRARHSLAMRNQMAREQREQDRAIQNTFKQRVEYVKLVKQIDELNKAHGKAVRSGDRVAVVGIEVKQERAIAQMAIIKKELEAVGSPVDLEANVFPGHALGMQIRRIAEDRHWGAAGWHAGILFGTASVRGVKNAFRPSTIAGVLKGVAGGVASKMGDFFRSLSTATIRLGPFTATVKQALLALTALGPILIDAVGGLSALLGVVGSATLGLGALSAGFLGGAIPAAIGMGVVIRDVFKDFQDATKASAAYNKALREHGEGSTQAANAQKKLKNVLGDVDESTLRAFKSAQGLGKRWSELTKPARASAFNVIGDAINYASDNMGSFASRTNVAMKAASEGIRGWIRGLNSVEGRQVLGTMMDNFNASIKPGLQGLGSLAAALGRVGAVASGFLPGFAMQFRNWARGVSEASKNTDRVTNSVQRWVDSLRAVGRFLQAFGRLTTTVFGGGVKSGVKLLDDMSNAMNRWNTTLKGTEGQEKLHLFFERAVQGMQALYSFLAPIIRLFTQWSSTLSPVTAGIFSVLGAVNNFLAALTSVVALRAPLMAFGATLATVWGVGKISAATQAVIGFSRALLGMQALSSASAAATAMLGPSLVGTAGGAAAAAAAQRKLGQTAAGTATKQMALGAAAGATSGQMGILRKGVAAFSPRLAGMAVAGGAAAGALGLLAAGATYGAYKLVTMKSGTDKAKDSVAQLEQRTTAASQAFRLNASQAGNVGGVYARNRIILRDLKKQLDGTKKGTDEHRIALLNYRDGLRNVGQSERDWATTKRNATTTAREQTRALEDQIPKLKALVESARFRGDEDDLEKYSGKLARIEAAAERAGNRQAAVAGNLARAYRGLDPVLGQAEQKLGELARKSKGLAAKISVKFDAPQDVGKVAARATRALRAGVPKRLVTRAVVDSKTAEQAVKRLRNLRIKAVRFQIIQRGGQEAIRVLEKIKGTKLTRKEQRIAERGGAAAIKMFERLRGQKLTKKEQLIVEAGGRKVRTILGVIKAFRLGTARKGVTDSGQGKALLNRLRQLMGITNLKTAVKTIETHHKTIFDRPGQASGRRRTRAGAAGGVFATGGITSAAMGTGASPDERRVERALFEAERRQEVDSRKGLKVSRPTILAGEENRPEFVISTNPRYQKRNEALLEAATRAVSGRTRTLREDRREGIISAAAGNRPGYFDNTPVQDYSGGAGFSRRTRRRAAFRSRRPRRGRRVRVPHNPWATQLERLEVRQQDLEREANIRQGAVREPEDFITEQQQPDGTTKFSFDWPAWSGYVEQVKQVQEVFKRLQQVVREIMETVPKATALNNEHIRQHNLNMRMLQDQIAAQRRVISRTGGNSERAKQIRANAKKRIEKYRKRYGLEKDARTKKREFGATLPGISKEAGFNFREYDQELVNLSAELGEKYAGAQREVARSTSEGGGGAGSSNLSYGQEVAATRAEQASVLREHSSNFTPVRSRPPGSGGGGTSRPGIPPERTKGPQTSSGRRTQTSSQQSQRADQMSKKGATKSKPAAGSSERAATMGAQADAKKSQQRGGVYSAEKSDQKGGDRYITINNEYKTAPSDPHTWSKGMEYEVASTM